MRYSVIIPCYNESENIPQMMKRLKLEKAYEIEWILVDNGSTDNTYSMLYENCKDNSSFSIVHVDVNKGYGYGINKGLEAASGDYLGWIHADMQVSPRYILSFIGQIEKNSDCKHLFLKGKRKNRDWLERVFTALMSIYASIIFGTILQDIGAIPVFFHRDLLMKASKIPYDFSIETYMYMIAKKEHYVIKRYPVYLERRKKGKSSWNKGVLSKFKQSWITAKDLILIRLGKQII